MEKEITPLKEFDKNINYYQLIVKLQECLTKTKQLKNAEDLIMFFNEIKAIIFNDETLKSIYIHNIEKQCNNKKYPTEEENELNTKALISYIEQAGYEYKYGKNDNNVIIDCTNHCYNNINDYFFPSFYKYVEKKLNIEIKDYYIDDLFETIDFLEDVIGLNFNLECFNIMNFDKIVFKKLFEFDNLNGDFFMDDYHFLYYRTLINSMLNDLISIIQYKYCDKYYNVSLKDIKKNLKQKKLTQCEALELLLIENPVATCKELGEKMGIEAYTVPTYIKRLCEKYGLEQQNKTALIAFLQQN